VALIIITFQEQGEAELQDGEIDKNQVRLHLTMKFIEDDNNFFLYFNSLEILHRFYYWRTTIRTVHAKGSK
jgi:hypothetical protein